MVCELQPSLGGVDVYLSRTLARIAAMGTAVAAASALLLGSNSMAVAHTAAPKAYVGLFGDNAVARPGRSYDHQ
jgi:hypothetical protein